MPLLEAIFLLKDTFHKYAGKDGDATTLTKSELSELLKVELLGGQAPCEAAVQKVFSDLDDDKNGVVNMNEFVIFVLAMSCAMQDK